jgi:hypothetical protein
MDKNKLKKEMLEAIFVKTGGRPENPEIAEICAEIAVKNCSIPAVSGHVQNYKDCKVPCRYRDVYRKSVLKRG